MIDLTKFRIIDLSAEVVPGERKIDGRYLHGEPRAGRLVEVQEFTAFDARMHFIQGQTHLATHVEAPYKYAEDGADMAGMPIESYIGEAVACNLTNKKPREAVTAEDFQHAAVKTGDIVLAWTACTDPDNLPYLDPAAVDWLIKTRIKLLAIENLDFGPPDAPRGTESPDAKLLLAGIPIVDDVVNLTQIIKPRVFFIALPLRMRRVTASWTRAIALEEIA